MKRTIPLMLMLAPLLATAGVPAFDMAAFSNKLDRVAATNEQGYLQKLDANRFTIIDSHLCEALGRPVPTSGAKVAPDALHNEHQSLVAAYVQDIKQRIASTQTWPAGQTPAVWSNAATALLDQAAGFHRDALAANADVTSSLRLMNQVRAWTQGHAELPASDDWTESVQAQAEAKTEGTPAPATAGTAKSPNGPDSPTSSSAPAVPAATAPLQPGPEAAPPLPLTAPAVSGEPAAPASSGPTAVATEEQPRVTAVTLTWVSRSGANGKLAVRHNLSTTNKAAWIGFFKHGAADRDYLSYTFLNNLTDKFYDVPAPVEAGAYEFRIYSDADYTPAAVSEPAEIR